MNNTAATGVCDLARRSWLLQSAMAAGGLLVGSGRVLAAAEDGVSRSCEAIHQEVIFSATPRRIYDALLDASQFQKVEVIGTAMEHMDVTTHPAMISREPGGAFSLFGAYIVGRHIELVPNERIVQAWRVEGWMPGIYSVARFALMEQGSSTKLVFDHTGFPPGTAEHLAAGWYQHYWEPLKKYLA
jgi:activator of HSP90 ATPase